MSFIDEVTKTRIIIFRYVVSFCFLIIFFGFWSLQVLSSDKYLKLSENNRFMKKILNPPRGLMVDRNGKILTANRIAYNFSLIKENSRDLDNSLELVSRLFGISHSDLLDRIDKYSYQPSFRPIIIAEDISFSQLAYIESHRIENPEFSISTEQKRIYLAGRECAHLIGYVGEIRASQRGKAEFDGMDAGDIVGQTGLERKYNSLLIGTKGYSQVVVNNQGREIEIFESLPPTKGKMLKLSIMQSLQQEALDAFDDEAGAAIALNPNNGEVLLLGSYPSFDPNMFTTRFSTKQWNSLMNDSRHPLQNRVISGLYSPGSVFKVLMALAALEEGVITPETRFYCGGSGNFYGRTFRCWKTGGHGSMNLSQALKHSCNIYFYNIGKLLGIEKIKKYATMFGLGITTGIDIPGEKSGLVPSPEWKKRVIGERWYSSEDISVVIGQGALQVTPLQLAVMMCAVGNGGKLVIPHIVKQIDNSELYAPHVIKEDYHFNDENVKLVKNALWDVVNSHGTGWRAAVKGRDVCGKTGTAQVVSSKLKDSMGDNVPEEYKEHSWFVCFAPKDNPEIALAVLVEHGGHGGESAAPIAKKILERFFYEKDRK